MSAPEIPFSELVQHRAEVHADPDPPTRTHLLEGDLGPVPDPA
jgi:hypothetical protein